MRMIRAIIRPDREEAVVDALESAGIVSLTVYSELPKIMLTIVVEEAKLDAAITAIRSSAKTGQHGDGKIFISPVDTVYTVRTGQMVQE